MRRLVIAVAAGIAVIATAAPVAAKAHGRHPHGRWHHPRYVGPSYYPVYGLFNDDPYGPVCVWHRDWDAYWHRDCF
jgi:hypothetical protein